MLKMHRRSYQDNILTHYWILPCTIMDTANILANGTKRKRTTPERFVDSDDFQNAYIKLMMEDVPASEVYAALEDEDFSSEESDGEEIPSTARASLSDDYVEVSGESETVSDSEEEFEAYSTEDDDDEEEEETEDEADIVVDQSGAPMDYNGRKWPLSECCDAFIDRFNAEGLKPGTSSYIVDGGMAELRPDGLHDVLNQQPIASD